MPAAVATWRAVADGAHGRAACIDHRQRAAVRRFDDAAARGFDQDGIHAATVAAVAATTAHGCGAA
jgi:hypothetical protein